MPVMEFQEPRLRENDALGELPNELLTRIFLILRDRWLASPSGLVDWISVTHVSKRWREVAIGYPGLWASPDFTRHSRGRLEAFLERSRSFPLEIDNRTQCEKRGDGVYCETCEENVALVLKHFSRARTVKLDKICLDHLAPAFDIPAPSLVELELTIQAAAPVFLPEQFLSQGAPALRRVHLRSCNFSPQAQITLFRNLTHLKITDCYEGLDYYSQCAPFYPNLQELLEILKFCPELKILSLGALKSTEGLPVDDIRNTEKIQLSELKRISIDILDAQNAENLSFLLEYPTLFRVKLGIRYFRTTQTSSILSILRRFSRGQYHEELRITYISPGNVDFSSLGYDHDDNCFSMQFDLYHTDAEGNTAMGENPDHSPVMQAVAKMVRDSLWKQIDHFTLDVSSRSPSEVSLWAKVFEAMPQMTAMSLRLNYVVEGHAPMINVVRNILLALTPRQEADSEVLLPSLDYLVFCYAEVQKIRDSISDCLYKRDQAGQRLPHLVFNRCNGKKECREWRRSVRNNVDKIEWLASLDEYVEEEIRREKLAAANSTERYISDDETDFEAEESD